ncbi:autotransporter outer membrane beta-barrel domain-containing protein [Pandoraea fibrosis]|uniref:Autotransporter outer membrane beta-barrel domain-containing protein n=1 Tax=Pandoraea fibrosis TaxID=1891094 RepID=A0ABX6HNH5_9BURK|nr:autotransporter outer membrane beta-barrel domain-containing protein [Pandoraea fibrosis]QHE94366.1 autotransporter outer membrane beta-barrel domain-containing protein [Pandoraea fibrosis]QHF12070.1 autotransporter outer membrane beta-barrel domain-containing protein [Pandoraea fibrosis]
MTHAMRQHLPRRRPLSVAVSLVFLSAGAAQAQTYPLSVIPSGSILTYEQYYDGNVVPVGVIQGTVTIHPVPPYPAQLGGAGVSVFNGAVVTIDPNQGVAGQVSITSDYQAGAPNDALYIANGTVKITPSAGGVLLRGRGTSVHGVYMPETSSGTSLLQGGNVTITTDGSTADGIRAYGSTSTINLDQASITVSGADSWGVRSWGGSNITLSNSTVTSVGTGGGGLQVFNGSSGTINGNSTITTAVDGNLGLNAEAGGTLNTNTDANTPGTVVVSTTGAGSHAVRIGTANGNLNRLRLSTTQNSTYGLLVNGTSTVTGSQVAVSTLGTSAYGMWISGSTTATLNGGSISTQGQTAYGLLSGSGAATVNLSDFAITTQGVQAYGIYGWTGSTTHFAGGSITTNQASTYGIYANAGTVNLLTSASGAGTAITTSGANAYVVRIQNGGLFNATGATLHATGAGGAGIVFDAPQTVAAMPTSVATPGLPTLPTTTAGLTSLDPPPALAITTPYPSAPTEVGSDIVGVATGGVGGVAAPPRAGGYNMTLQGTTVTSDQSAALWIYGGVANVNLVDSTLTGSAGAVYATTRAVSGGGELGATLNLDANHSVLNGRILTDTTSTSVVNLSNSSTWHVTASSNVTELSNANSLIDFPVTALLASAPTSQSSYRTVNVGNSYVGNGGTVALNTYLNEGGALTNQYTDRLLIAGSASGTTLLQIKPVAGSPGKLTSPTGVITNDEGISVVQVGGTSTFNAFRLAGGYVVAPNSPYEYRLYAYGPGSVHGTAEASQNLVGTGGGFWDYRLQSAYVDPGGEVDPEGPGGPGGEIVDPVPPDARPEVAPQVPAYLSAPQAFLHAGLMDLDSLHRRLGEVRDDRELGRDRGPGEMFVRGYGGNFRYFSNQSFQAFGYDMRGDYGAIQIGGNLFKHVTEDGTWRFGAAGSMGWLHYEPDAVDGASSTRSSTYRLYGYGTYQSQQGWYVDGIVSVGWFNGQVNTDVRTDVASMRGNSYAASVEAGYPLALAYGLNLEPQLQFVGQHLAFRNMTDADGLSVNIGSQNQVTGRLGVRLTRPIAVSTGRVTPYVGFDLVHAFVAGTSVQVGEAMFQTGKYGDAMVFSLGVNGTQSANLSMYGRVSYQQSFGTAGMRGVLVNVGAKYVF